VFFIRVKIAAQNQDNKHHPALHNIAKDNITVAGTRSETAMHIKTLASTTIILAASLFLYQPVAFANEEPGDNPSTSASEIPFYALSLIGTPYKYGGKSPQTGMDCSGFVGHVFKQAVGMQLPASSSEISRHGEPLQNHELRPGDLVFFNTLNRAFSHVGIYLGENRFVHSTSSSTGSVMVSNMDENYWAKRFNGARRLIDTQANTPQP
jgi:cell wall-associated NlpC family hydrolase